MTALSHRPVTFSTPYVLSWAFSILFHGLTLGFAVVLMTDFRLAPQPEPFKWDVSVLEPLQSARQPRPSPTRTSPTPQAEPKPIEPQPVVQTMQQEAQTATPVVPAAPQPVRPEPQVIARTAQPIETPPPAIMEQPAAAAPAASTQPASTVSAPAETAARILEQVPASAPSSGSTAQAKRDYGWLTEVLWNRIERLKRYPSLARLNQWEGKVVLRVVIKETGDLVDLRIAQSSGHDILDQDALETMKQAAPLNLKQPLGQPQIVVHIPISYKLDR